MAVRYAIKIEQGATFRLVFFWREPLRDPLTGEAILDAEGIIQQGPPLSLAGYIGRMHIRKAIKDTTPLLTLTSANGGILIPSSAIVVRPIGYARVASTVNLDLTGAETVDGVVVATGDRVLVKNQTAPAENGIYLASTTAAWTRAPEADAAAELTLGAAVYVLEGATQRKTDWRQSLAVAALSDPQTWTKSTDLGKVEIVATDEQTSTLTSSGVYDLELESGGGEVNRVLEGKMRLSAEVTR